MKKFIYTGAALENSGQNKGSIKFGRQFGSIAFVILLLGVLFLTSCSSNQAPASNLANNSSVERTNVNQTATSTAPTNSPSPTASAASITASPNPVPAGKKSFGKTTVTWNTGDANAGQVYVAVNDGEEKIFADGRPQGSQDAPWIGAGATYEFRLYSGKDHKKLLASVKVIRDK
jgi:hypothetical protein